MEQNQFWKGVLMNDHGSGPSFPMASLAQLKNGVKARQVSTHTHDRAEMPGSKFLREIGHWDCKKIPAGSSWEFPQMQGPGCVNSVWLTFAENMLHAVHRSRVPAHKYLWINIYFDDADLPAVSAPVGHFFGNGATKYVSFSSKFVGMTSGGYYSFLPMPFQKSCRVRMENRHPSRDIALFFGAIGYLQLPKLDPEMGMLHAQYRVSEFIRSKDIKGALIPNNPHVILEEKTGPGHYVGTTLVIYPVHALKSRFYGPQFGFPYLEGNLKVYVDDEVHEQGPDMIEKPVGAPYGAQSIEFTGAEDYFLSGWYYIKGPFTALYHGCPVRSVLTGVVSQYRFHEADPYPWKDRIKMTITHGEFDQIDCRMESLAFYYLKP
jgi:hypothetical protein